MLHGRGMCGAAQSPRETSTGKIPRAWMEVSLCLQALLLGGCAVPNRTWPLRNSHICFVAKLFLLVALSLSGLILTLGVCLEPAALPGGSEGQRGVGVCVGKVQTLPAISNPVQSLICQVSAASQPWPLVLQELGERRDSHLLGCSVLAGFWHKVKPCTFCCSG